MGVPRQSEGSTVSELSESIESKPFDIYSIIPRAVVVGIAFYLCARIGLSLSFPPDHVSVFWPPNAVVLTALLLSRRRTWWLFLVAMGIAYIPAALQAGFSPQRVSIFFVANCSEVLIAAGGDSDTPFVELLDFLIFEMSRYLSCLPVYWPLRFRHP